MLPSLTSHCDYVFFVNDSLKSIEIPKAHTPVPEKLALLDLTPIRLLMLDLYCPEKGRIGYAPEDLLQTFLAMSFVELRRLQHGLKTIYKILCDNLRL